MPSERCEFEQAHRTFVLDQDIKVAVFALLSPDVRPENTERFDAVLLTQLGQMLPNDSRAFCGLPSHSSDELLI